MVCGGTHSRLADELGRAVDHPGFEADPGRDHLERRAWHEPLLVGAGEQRIAGCVLQVDDRLLRVLERQCHERVRVVGRVAVHRTHGAGLDVDHDDRTRATAERELGDLLQIVADRQLHRPRVVDVARQDVAERAHLLLGRVAGEHVAVHPLDLGRPEVQREVPGDIRQQVAGRIARGCGRTRHRVRGSDVDVAATTPSALMIVAARLVELASDRARVLDVRVELLLLRDLPVVERCEQHDVAGHQADGELTDLAVHPVPPAWAAARLRSRRTCRRSCHAAHRSLGVGSSGTSPSRRAAESETRMRSASRM